MWTAQYVELLSIRVGHTQQIPEPINEVSLSDMCHHNMCLQLPQLSWKKPNTYHHSSSPCGVIPTRL